MTQPTYIATTTDPAVAAHIRRNYPGSYIVPQNGALHIYTQQPQKHPPNGHKKDKPIKPKSATTSIFDRLPWWIGAIGLGLLLLAIS